MALLRLITELHPSASWRARCANLVLRCCVKSRLRRYHEVEPRQLNATRRRGRFCASWLVVPILGTQIVPVNHPGVRGEWIIAPGASRQRVIFFVGGGAFMIGSLALYHRLTSILSAASGAAVFSVDYRRAPEHPFPAALEDVRAAWEWLTGSVLNPDCIVAGGDSAGGNLMLSNMLRLRDERRRLPTGVIAIAPWTDLTLSGDTLIRNAAVDPYIPANLLKPVVDAYLQGADPASSRASPLFGSLDGFPPMMIHVGQQEVLLDDSRRLAEAAHAAGVDVTLKLWNQLPHVFQLFSPFVPEAHVSLHELGAFAHRRLIGEPA